MIKKYLPELKLLKEKTRALDFKVVYIFISVAVITFLSMEFASPNFYYDHIGKDRFDSRIYWFLMDGFLMFALPALSIKLIFKEPLSKYGWQWGDYKFGLFTVGLFLLVMLPVLWIASASETFAKTYPQGGSKVSINFTYYFIYEMAILIYMLGWEFFWRGFMLFGLKEKFGYYSIFIQMIPFFILHKGKPELEVFASIFAGLVLGVQALRANSFIYCWLIHWLVMVFIDGISILREKNEFYNIF